MIDERSDMSGQEENRSDPDIISSSSCSTCLDGTDQVLENVLHFLTARGDRNSASLLCKSWYRAEALTRFDLFIGNCYAVSPRQAVERFRRVRSVVLKGKPRFSDFGLVTPNWGAHFAPWVTALADAYPGLEWIYLKRMSVTDEDLVVVASSFAGFKSSFLSAARGSAPAASP